MNGALARAAVMLGLLALSSSAKPKTERLEVGLDPRLEVLYAVRALGRPDDYPSPAALASLRGHEAVKLDRALDLHAFNTRTRYESIVRRDLAAWEEPAGEVSTRFTLPAGGREAWERWIAALDRFAKEPAFVRHLEGRRKELASLLASTRASLAELRVIEAMEEYTGLPFHGTHLIALSPFPESDLGSAFGLVVRKTDGSYFLVNGFPVGELDMRQRAPYIWHETAHGFMDPLADVSHEDVARSEKLYEKHPDCRGQWRQCVKEHVNDAVAARVFHRVVGDGKDYRAFTEFIAIRHPYAPALIARLEAWEKQPRPRDLAAYYSKLLEAFPAAPLPGKKPGDGVGPNLIDTVTMPFWTPGERERASEILEKTIPGSRGPGRLALSAAFHQALGRGERAVQAATAALERTPDDAMALAVRAAARQSLGRYDEAFADAEKARRSCVKRPEQPACAMNWPVGSPLPPKR